MPVQRHKTKGFYLLKNNNYSFIYPRVISGGAYKNSLNHERALKTGKMLHKISKMFKMSTCMIIKVLPLSRPYPLPLPPSFIPIQFLSRPPSPLTQCT